MPGWATNLGSDKEEKKKIKEEGIFVGHGCTVQITGESALNGCRASHIQR